MKNKAEPLLRHQCVENASAFDKANQVVPAMQGTSL